MLTHEMYEHEHRKKEYSQAASNCHCLFTQKKNLTYVKRHLQDPVYVRRVYSLHIIPKNVEDDVCVCI